MNLKALFRRKPMDRIDAGRPRAALDLARATTEMERLFEAHDGRTLDKWLHYLPIYDRWFQPFRGRPVTLVEVGISRGGSLELWRRFFGPQARIIGVDVKPRAVEAAPPDAEFMLGDQGDPAFLARLAAAASPLHIVIDDGSHIVEHQIATFEALFPALADGGVYVCEDLHTSYWREFGGRDPGPLPAGGRETFIDRVKALIDRMHAFHAENPATFPVDHWTTDIASIHIADSIAVIEKRRRGKPVARKVGAREHGRTNETAHG